jgi:hypothetical protein
MAGTRSPTSASGSRCTTVRAAGLAYVISPSADTTRIGSLECSTSRRYRASLASRARWAARAAVTSRPRTTTSPSTGTRITSAMRASSPAGLSIGIAPASVAAR